MTGSRSHRLPVIIALAAILLAGAQPTAAGVPGGPDAPARLTAASFPSAWFTVTRFCVQCAVEPPAGTEVTYLVTPNDTIQGVPWTSYEGTVTFSSTDPRAILPEPYTFTGGDPGADQGEHFFTVVYRTAGAQTLAVSSKTPVKMSGTADPVQVVPNVSDHLTIDATPAGAIVAEPFSPQPVVRVRDAYGNITDSTAIVTLSLETPPEGAGALFTCADGIQRTAVAGTAIYSGCAIGRVANGYRLRADASGVASARTDYFIVSFPPTGPPPPGATPSPRPSPSPAPTPSPSPSPTQSPGGSQSPAPSSTPAPTPLPTGPPGPGESPSPGPPTPRLSRSPATVTYPGVVTLSLTFEGAGAGRVVTIERRNADAADWTPIGEITTDADGRGSLSTVPGRTARYRAVWAGTDGLPASTGPAVTATVRFELVVSPAFTTRTVRWGTTLTWNVKLRPRTRDVAVTFALYEWSGGRWALRSTVVRRTPSSGVVTYARKFLRNGRWTVAISTAKGPANAPGTAPRIVVTVR